MKKAAFILVAVSFGWILSRCTPSTASTTDTTVSQGAISMCATPAVVTDAGGLRKTGNPDVIKRLELPATITYLGLEPPAVSPKDAPVTTAPDGMVLIPGGNVQIGSEEGFGQELPLFWASVKPFLMDKSPVTVGQFRAFVLATGYKTEAEKLGNAGVINEETGKQWLLIEGACWEYPLGKERPKAPDNHPVTQVSWNDAKAYAKWAGKRLPCEIEWEHAARNARNSRTKYPWGEEIQSNGQWKANVWQGKFPVKNFVEDAYPYTSPVGQFGKTELGLTDMSGNVWEWMSNRKFNYAALFQTDNDESGLSVERAQRGGSFLCEPTWCHGYRVSGRSGSTEDTGLFHLGFRCVKDIP
ncbi:MAG: formylglycine-generating enzyme family protein [Spirosomataceae bacterium]